MKNDVRGGTNFEQKTSEGIILSESSTSDLRSTVIDNNHFSPDDKQTTKLKLKKEESKIKQIIDQPITYDVEGISDSLFQKIVERGEESKN